MTISISDIGWGLMAVLSGVGLGMIALAVIQSIFPPRR